MDLSSTSVQLCLQGTQAEFERRLDDARALFAKAWEAAVDDYDRSVAAHYVAHLELDIVVAHRWNQLALEYALADERASEFLGSLYVSLGDTYERLGDSNEAERCFDEAAKHGVEHYRG
jgi:tetratricopeptide (TPR) repeat protein